MGKQIKMHSHKGKRQAFYILKPKELCRDCGESLYKTLLTRRIWCKKCREYKDIHIWRMMHGKV